MVFFQKVGPIVVLSYSGIELIQRTQFRDFPETGFFRDLAHNSFVRHRKHFWLVANERYDLSNEFSTRVCHLTPSELGDRSLRTRRSTQFWGQSGKTARFKKNHEFSRSDQNFATLIRNPTKTRIWKSDDEIFINIQKHIYSLEWVLCMPEICPDIF